MDSFDLDHVAEFLSSRLSPSNLSSCMRVIKKLVSGQGVTHRSKPGEAFLFGHKLSPKDDLEEIRREGNEWLPYRKGPGCLDKGHGWAINHPLTKLILYRDHVLASAAPCQAPVPTACL